MHPHPKSPSQIITSFVLIILLAIPLDAAGPLKPELSDAAAQNLAGQANPQGEKKNTTQTSINVTVNALSNRHTISPYVYGVNFPNDTTYIQQSGATLVRWGGNASTRYNWKNFDTNAANDWYFDNRTFGSPPLYQDSTQFLSNVVGAG